MQAVMTSTEKYSRLSATDRGIIDQLIDFALFKANTDRANSCANNERTEEKKEEKK